MSSNIAGKVVDHGREHHGQCPAEVVVRTLPAQERTMKLCLTVIGKALQVAV
jgi:hypothetical protein